MVGRVVAGLAALLAAAGTVAGCSSSAAATADISIVASTDVYGAVAQQLVAGLPTSRVAVTSLISDPSVDPHSYVANPRTELAISRADLIIQNGGGYDDFVATMRRAAGSTAPVIDAVQVSGHADDANLNEHVWYDIPTVERVAEHITAFLVAHDRADVTALRRNAASFRTALHRLEGSEARIRAASRGAGVAVTEPVPLYLVQACGLVNRTPAEFSRAIEEETDASPRVLQSVLDLFSAHRVRLLIYNAQTAGPQTDQVIAAARANGIPVVAVTETLPGQVDYPQWMRGVLRDVAGALS